MTNSILQKIPGTVFVDEDYSVKPPKWSSFEDLMESIRTYGPLVVSGRMGEQVYSQPVYPLQDTVDEQTVYGGVAGSFNPNSTPMPAILLGGQANAHRTQKPYVYYIMAKDITSDKDSLIRGYRPNPIDKKIYTMSYENFKGRSLLDLYAICPHGEWLFLTPDPKKLIDKGETEKKCKEIGQAIFDQYKAVRGSSMDGKAALQRIYEAVRFLSPDASIRMPCISRAWDGVGDPSIAGRDPFGFVPGGGRPWQWLA